MRVFADTRRILDHVERVLRAVDEEGADPVEAINTIFAAVSPGIAELVGDDPTSDDGVLTEFELRDWFAAHADPLDEELSFGTIAALTGLTLQPALQEGEPSEARYARNIRWLAEANARYRYMQADAMLAEWKRGGAS